MVATILMIFPKLYQTERDHNQSGEDFSFSHPWPWAYFLNGSNAAASISSTLIRHCWGIIGHARCPRSICSTLFATGPHVAMRPLATVNVATSYHYDAVPCCYGCSVVCVWLGAYIWLILGLSRRSHITFALKQLHCSVLFFSRPRSEGWPHHGRTFSIYPCPLSF